MQAAAPKGLPCKASLFKRQALYKASPARGCGVERRLRRRKRDGAGLTVAEHKRASARAVRCGHRKPDGGCAARRRRRGALPACGGDILQNPAGPCPVFRRDDLRAKSRHFVLCAPKQRMRAAVLASARKPRNAANPRRRAKSPALHCGLKRALTRKRQPTARPVGGPMQASAPTQGTAALHDRHPPSCLPPRSRRPSALHCRAGVHARRGGLRRGNAAFLRKRRTVMLQDRGGLQ